MFYYYTLLEGRAKEGRLIEISGLTPPVRDKRVLPKTKTLLAIFACLDWGSFTYCTKLECNLEFPIGRPPRACQNSAKNFPQYQISKNVFHYIKNFLSFQTLFPTIIN